MPKTPVQLGILWEWSIVKEYSSSAKKCRGFGRTAVYHLTKTVFTTTRTYPNGNAASNQNPHYENDTYRQSVRIRPLHRSCRLGLGRSREQTHGTCLFRREVHLQYASRAQGNEAGWPSGQRLCLQPLTQTNPGTTSPGGNFLWAFSFLQGHHHELLITYFR